MTSRYQQLLNAGITAAEDALIAKIEREQGVAVAALVRGDVQAKRIREGRA
jgi:hypothetical protein